MVMRVRSQRKANKRCVCVCGWVGGAQHLTHCVVDSVCSCMAASVESGQFPIDCLCVPCTHTYVYVRTYVRTYTQWEIV